MKVDTDTGGTFLYFAPVYAMMKSSMHLPDHLPVWQAQGADRTVLRTTQRIKIKQMTGQVRCLAPIHSGSSITHGDPGQAACEQRRDVHLL